MPDLSKMRVKVGIHESVIDRMREGLVANVTLSSRALTGSVSEVAAVTRPAGWWTGNEVRYDTWISLPPEDGLMPGMSADVEIVVATHRDVLRIPVAAIVETDAGPHCWIRTTNRSERRKLELGDSNGVFTIVERGIAEGDEVILNPSSLEEVGNVSDAPVEARDVLDSATDSLAP